jgi:hypothetical protein
MQKPVKKNKYLLAKLENLLAKLEKKQYILSPKSNVTNCT